MTRYRSPPGGDLKPTRPSAFPPGRPQGYRRCRGAGRQHPADSPVAVPYNYLHAVRRRLMTDCNERSITGEGGMRKTLRDAKRGADGFESVEREGERPQRVFTVVDHMTRRRVDSPAVRPLSTAKSDWS